MDRALSFCDRYLFVMTKTKKQTNKTRGQSHAQPSALATIHAPLSPQWAFLVQFRALPKGQVYRAGRVEHLVSGRASHFQSLEELNAYLTAELHASENKAEH